MKFLLFKNRIELGGVKHVRVYYGHVVRTQYYLHPSVLIHPAPLKWGLVQFLACRNGSVNVYSMKAWGNEGGSEKGEGALFSHLHVLSDSSAS